MILLTGFYTDTIAARRDELATCLRLNLANPHFERVCLLVEDATDPLQIQRSVPHPQHAKLRMKPLGRRARYSDFFEYANGLGAGHKIVVANADIWFDETLSRVRTQRLEKRLLCLSRWDVQANGRTLFYYCVDSQDAWIFVTPIPHFPCDFSLGTPGCDNRIAWEAEHAGLEVSNPSLSIRANHLHLSAVRHYSLESRLEGPRSKLPASHIGGGLTAIGDVISRVRVGLWPRAVDGR